MNGKKEKTIGDFIEYLSMRGYSPRTVEAYEEHLKKFAGFLEKYYPRITAFSDVSKDIIQDYQRFVCTIRTREGRPLANTSQNKKLTPVRKFFSFLLERDLVLRDPTKALVHMKEEQRLTRNIFSEQEVRELFESIDARTPVGLRNRAIVELLYACGIRTSELCNLKVENIDFKEQTVTVVKGKGGKSRLMPIGQYAAFYIERYVQKARKYMLKGKREDPGQLFLSSRGQPFTRSTINSTVMRTLRKGFDAKKHFSCYSFRHSVAQHLLANKVDIAYIAQLLGHSSLRTTQRYLHIEISDLKKMHSLYHPRERDLCQK